jgi:serine/threonine protein kinase/cytochrome c-type biogenesis protein CcmH/NrfG
MTDKYEIGSEPVPGYRLVRFLGQGAFGQVWQANAPGGTETALKIISLSGKQGLKEFRALGLVKRIRHPNLVPIVAFWLKDASGNCLDDALALEDLEKKASEVSELVATMVAEIQQSPRPVELVIAMGLGEKDLGRRLEECRAEGLQGIPVKELLGYMEDSARAIDYLNRPRTSYGAEGVAVQHCDIKPFNIMIVGDAAQVCDFGLARMLGDVRKTATAAGTVAYVSPECLSNCEPSLATDQYSLAVTYVELRTGSLPYRSEKLPEVVNAVLKGQLDLSRLTEAEQEVIRRATALDPFDRWPSSMEMVHALRRAVESPSLPLKQRKRDAKKALAMVLVATLVTAGLGAWYLWPTLIAMRVNGSTKTVATTPSAVDTSTVDVPKADTPKIDTPPVPDVVPAEPMPPATASPAPDIVVATKEPMPPMTASPPTTPPDNPPETTTPPTTPDTLKLATDLFSHQEFDQALALLNPYMTATPNAEAFLLRGTIYLEKADYRKAIADLTMAITLDNRDFRSYSRRATAYLRQGNHVGAIADFTRAIEIDPDARDYIGRGRAYWSAGSDDAAIADMNQAIKLDPTSADGYASRASLYFNRRQWKEALADFNAALSHDGDDPYLLGDAARLLATAPVANVRDGKRAVELATRACDLTDGTNAGLLEVLAAALAESGDFDAASQRIRQAIELTDDADAKKDYLALQQLFASRKAYHLSP